MHANGYLNFVYNAWLYFFKKKDSNERYIIPDFNYIKKGFFQEREFLQSVDAENFNNLLWFLPDVITFNKEQQLCCILSVQNPFSLMMNSITTCACGLQFCSVFATRIDVHISLSLSLLVYPCCTFTFSLKTRHKLIPGIVTDFSYFLKCRLIKPAINKITANIDIQVLFF